MSLPTGITIQKFDKGGYIWKRGDFEVALFMRSAPGGFEQAWCVLCRSFDCEHALAVLEFEVPSDSEWRLSDDL